MIRAGPHLLLIILCLLWPAFAVLPFWFAGPTFYAIIGFTAVPMPGPQGEKRKPAVTGAFLANFA